MKTKREVLERFAEAGGCSHIRCPECEYNGTCCVGKNLVLSLRLQKIGAMAILRMFKKKKKPLLSDGMKIKFSNGKIYTIESCKDVRTECFILRNNKTQISYSLDLLINKTWEVVE